MLRRHSFGMFVLATLPAWARPASANVIVRFDPPTKIVQVGDDFTMNIVGDLSSAIAGWGLDMNVVNAAVANQTAGVTIGPSWVAVFAPDADELAGLAFPSGVSGTGVVLATVNFHANMIGQTDVNVSVTQGDLTEGFALDPTGFDTVTFEPGHIDVVPEPLSGTLATAALLLLGKRRR